MSASVQNTLVCISYGVLDNTPLEVILRFLMCIGQSVHIVSRSWEQETCSQLNEVPVRRFPNFPRMQPTTPACLPGTYLPCNHGHRWVGRFCSTPGNRTQDLSLVTRLYLEGRNSLSYSNVLCRYFIFPLVTHLSSSPLWFYFNPVIPWPVE